MYGIYSSKDYKKSYKKLIASGKLKKKTIETLEEVIDTIAAGEILPAEYKDHRLAGDLKDYRECHIQGDLLLIYKIVKKDLILVLIDLGSHSYLFG